MSAIKRIDGVDNGKSKDPSPIHDAHKDVPSIHHSPLTSDELTQWKHFTIDNGYLLHKGRVCVSKDN